MTSKHQQTAIANKIKKWLETAKQLVGEPPIFAFSITRLTSIKSLCENQEAAQEFAMSMAEKIRKQMNEAPHPEHIPAEEWQTHQTLLNNAVDEMKAYLTTPTPEGMQTLKSFLTEIDQLQGNDYRRVHWTTVHFVRSGYLLKLEYALRCFVDSDFDYWAYQLAKEYAEEYNPSYGSGLIPASVPALLEIAEFWCQYYFDQALEEKFPELMKAITTTPSQ